MSSEKSVSEDICRDTFGNRLKSLMKAIGKTQAVFADELGVSQGALSGVANDKHGHGRIWVTAIACVFNVNRKWLKTGESPMFMPPRPTQKKSEVVRTYQKDLEDAHHRIEKLAMENTRLRGQNAKWKVINEEEAK